MVNEPNTETINSPELFDFYKEGYDHMVALKQVIFSLTHLSEPNAIAVEYSQKIKSYVSPKQNAVWLSTDKKTVTEIAKNGIPVDAKKANQLKIDSSQAFQQVFTQRLMAWPEHIDDIKSVFPNARSPHLFPLCGKNSVLGFFMLDQPDSKEIFQFLGEFIGIMIESAIAHQLLAEQNEQLEEMAQLLINLNENLGSINHAGIDIARCENQKQVAQMVTDVSVRQLKAEKAAILLLDQNTKKINGISETGGIDKIETISIDIEKNKAMANLMKSGRVISHKDIDGQFPLGPTLLNKWYLIPLKEKGRPMGILVVDSDVEDIADALSILANQAGLMFYNLDIRAEQKNVIGLLSKQTRALQESQVTVSNLLDKTVKETIQLLIDLLAMSNPIAFGRSRRIQHLVNQILGELNLDNTWAIEVASMLSQIGLVAIPGEILEEIYKGKELSESERRLLHTHPKIGGDLLRRISQMHGVADIINYQEKNFDGSGFPEDDVSETNIPIGARILKIAIDFDSLGISGLSKAEAQASIFEKKGIYDSKIVDAFKKIRDLGYKKMVKTIHVRNFKPEMIIEEDIKTTKGILLVSKGQSLTEPEIGRLRNFFNQNIIKDSYKVKFLEPVYGAD